MSDVTRRTVLSTCAWTTPAVVISATAPAYATSGPKGPSCTVKGTVHACKDSKGKVNSYEYRVTVGCGKGKVYSVYIFDKKADFVKDKRGNVLYWVIAISSKKTAGSVLIKTTQGDVVKAVDFR